MELPGMTYRGAPLDDVELLERLPVAYAQLLAQRNGFVALGGALHVRGACLAPEWHSLRRAWEGEHRLAALFPLLADADVPFAEEATGDQFVLRDERVHRYRAASRALEPLGLDLVGFLDAAVRDPLATLGLDALAAFQATGSRLLPGRLLVPGDPPRDVPALERLRALARERRD